MVDRDGATWVAVVGARTLPEIWAEAVAAVVLNAAWVIASAAVILAGPLTPIGNLAVAAVATAVLLFAALEAVGLARLSEMPG
jgi:hypothetical protein